MCVHGIIGLSLRQIRSRDAGLRLPFLKLYSLEYQKGQIIKFKFEGTFLLRHSSRDVTILLSFLIQYREVSTVGFYRGSLPQEGRKPFSGRGFSWANHGNYFFRNFLL